MSNKMPSSLADQVANGTGTVPEPMLSPITAPNPKRQLRINTSFDTDIDNFPPPPYQARAEAVRTAPLLLHPPPRRAASQNVDSVAMPLQASDVSRPAPVVHPPPPPASPARPTRARAAGTGHARKISDKFKAIFTHVRRVSEPDDVHVPQPIVSGTLPKVARRAMHRRNESAPMPDDRIVQWIQETAAQHSPPRPRRSPNTASFMVTSANSHAEMSFPRFNPTTMSMLSQQAEWKKGFSPTADTGELLEPITAALYPVGKGLLGATARRGRVQSDMILDQHHLEVSHFSTPTTPASRAYTDRLDVTEEQQGSPATEPASSDGGSSFDPTWYMHPS